jgi:HK97 family phage portal protein
MAESFFARIGRILGDGLRRVRGVQYPEVMHAEEAATPVSFDSAMQLSAVWACVKLLSETVASLPLTVYRKSPSGRTVANRHWLQVLLTGKVNRYQTRVEFFETMLLNLVAHGNAYAIKQRSGTAIVGLMPIMSSQVQTVLLTDGTVVHEYHHDAGVDVLASANVWHLKLMGNGIVGMSPISYQRNTIGIAQGAEKAVGKIYRNGGKPSGTLKIDRVLTTEQRNEVRRNYNTLTTGTDDRLMVLEKGFDFEAISLSPQDIQLLDSRKFQIAEICRWYGVPSVMVNDNAGTSTWGSGIEQIMAGFYKVTLRPLLEKIEASINVNLLGEDRFTYECEFDFDALLRADMKSRYESYRVAIAAALMTPNEARRKEYLSDMEGGDALYIQGAMVPLTQAGRKPEPAQDEVEDGNETAVP